MDRKLQRHRADSLRQHGFLVFPFTREISTETHSPPPPTPHVPLKCCGLVYCTFVGL